MFNKTRPAIYLTGLATAVGLLAAALGWATFDPATRMIDIAPFSIDLLFAWVPMVAAPLLAFLAWLLGWKRRVTP